MLKPNIKELEEQLNAKNKQNTAKGIYSKMLEEKFQFGKWFAEQGDDYKRDVAASLSPGGVSTAYKKGDVASFNKNASREAVIAKAQAINYMRGTGLYNTPEYAYDRGKVFLSDTGYLSDLVPKLGESLSQSQKTDAEMDRIRQQTAETSGRWLDLKNASNDTELDRWYNMLMADYLLGDRNELFDFEKIDARYSAMSDEEYDKEYKRLTDQWDNLDWESLTGSKANNYKSNTSNIQAALEVVQGEVNRRSEFEALRANIHSDPNFEALSAYDGHEHAEGSLAAKNPDAFDHYYDQLYFINNPVLPEGYKSKSSQDWIEHYQRFGYDLMTPQEVKEYTYLVEEKRMDDAARYIDLLQPELNARKADIENAEKTVRAQHLGYGALDSAGTVLTNPLAAISTAAGAVLGIDDPNHPIYSLQRGNTTTRSVYGQTLGELAPSAKLFDQNVLTMGYNVLMSLGDMAMARAIGGGVSKATGGGTNFAKNAMQFIMSTESAASTYLEDLNRGWDHDQAIIHGLANGLIEAWTERGFMDSLFSEGGTFFSRFMKSGIAEGWEEIESGGLQIISDALVAKMGNDPSQVEEVYQAFAATMSESDAARHTLLYFANQLAADGLSGFASGGLMQAGNTAVQGSQYRGIGKAVVKDGDIEGVLKIAESYADNADVAEPAKRIREKQAKGAKIGNRDVGQLVIAVNQTIGEKNSKAVTQVLVDSVESRLEELGEEPSNAKSLAEFISNEYLGKKATLAERAKLRWSDAASQVFKELNSTATVSEEVVPGSIAGTEGQLEDGQYVAGDALAAEKNRVGRKWRNTAEARIQAVSMDTIAERARLQEATTTKTSTTTAVGKAHDKAKNLMKGKPKMGTREITAVTADGEEATGTFERVERKNGKLLMVMKDADTEIKVDADKITNGGDEGILTIINYAQEGARHEMSTDEINTMVNTYLHEGGDVDSFVQQFQDNYLSGYSGVNAPAGTISGGIASIAYEHGKAEAVKDEADRVARAQKARKVETPSVGWLGDVTSDTAIKGLGDAGGLDEAVKNMTATQQAMVEFGRRLAETAKINIAFFASKAGADGKYTTQNGSYDPNTHTIYLDINSGASTESGRQKLMKSGTLGAAIGRVAGHELTHVLEATSPEYYGKYKQAVKAALKAKNLDYASLVREKIDAALANGEKLTYAGAEAEVIADASEYMLQDSKFVKNMDQGLKGKVNEIVQKFLNKVNEAIRALTGGHIESAVLRTMTDGVSHYEKQLQDLWDMAFDEMLGAEVRTDAPVADMPNETEKVQKSRERDDAYMAAVERGDMVTAQKMVDEAAESAMPNSKIRNTKGKLLKVYHGTRAEFNVFDTSKQGGTNGTAEGFGIYLSDSQEVTSAYGQRQIGAYANITKPATSWAKTITVPSLARLIGATCKEEAKRMMVEDGYSTINEALPDTWISNYVDTYTASNMSAHYRDAASQIVQMSDSDMSIIQEVMVGMGIRDYDDAENFYDNMLTPTTGFDGFWTTWDNRNTGEKNNIILALRSSQIKLADPVAYDDSGNVIPLSERFNAANEDIRYSLRNVDHSEATLQENMRLVQKMNPVARLQGNEFKMGKTLKTDVKKYYASIGGAVHSPLFGQIRLSNSGIKDSLGHGMGPVKAIMYRAVPNVISDGKMIDYRDNWKSRGYDTALIAAPVSIEEGEYKGDYWVGVILNLYADSTQRFYVHEPIVVQKRSAPVVQTGTPEGATPGNEDSSIISILDKLNEVKQEIKETDTDDSSPDGIETDDDTESVYSTQKSIRDLPEDTVTYREFLGAMQPTSRMNETEKLLLKRYKENIRILDEKEKLIEEQERIIETATGDELTKAKNRLDIYRTQANRARRALTAAERDNGFARLMATAYSTLNRIPVGTAGNVADATDALEKDIANLTSQLKTIEASVSRTAAGQKAAFARGLFDRKQLNTVAQALKDTYGSRMSTVSIADRLALAYSEIYADSGADGAKRFSEAARSLAEDLIRNNKYRFHSDLLPMLTESIGTIILSETDIQEIKSAGLTVRQYKAMLAPYVKVTASGSDLSSYVSNAEYYGNGTLASIFSDGSDGDYAMKLYETISNEKAKEDDNGFEGRSEGQLTMDAMADIAGSILPLADNSNAFAQLRSEMLKYAGENAEAARAVSTAIERAKSASRKATSVWHAAVKDATLAHQAAEYYRNLEEQRRVVELLEQKQLLTEQLRGEAGKLLKAAQEKYQRQIDEIRLRRDINIEIGKRTRHIKRIVKRLNDRIIHEEDYKNVKEPLKPVVHKLVQTFIDGFGNMVFDQKTADRLRSVYDEIANEDGAPEFYSDDVANWLSELSDMKEWDALIRAEGSSSLGAAEEKLTAYSRVAEIADHIYKLVTAADEIFIDGKREKFNAFSTETGTALIERKDSKLLVGKARDAYNAFQNLLVKGNLTPQFFFEHLKNSGMTRLFDGLMRGQTEYAQAIREGQEAISEAKKKYNFYSWQNMKEGVQFHTEQGHDIALTVPQMMWVYATAKREATNKLMGTHHLDQGGFRYDENNIPRQKGKPWKAAPGGKLLHKLSQADVEKISNTLTAEQKACADELVSYLSNECAAQGNRASMELFGIKKYNEEYYFPFKTASDQRYQRSDAGAASTTNDARVKHTSFTHSLRKGANTPLVMGDFFDVIADHINLMATYSSFVVPIESMNRVMNTKINEEADGSGNDVTIRSLIGRKYGEASQKYIADLLKDLNGGPQTDNRGGLSALFRAFKRGAVMGSLSVTLQQPTAIIRAFAYVNPKYFAHITMEGNKKTWERMMKHSGTAVIKEIGKFDVGTGHMANDWIANSDIQEYNVLKRARFLMNTEGWKAVKDNTIEFLTSLPGVMDRITWTHIWKAVEAEQADQHPGMDRNSDEFLDMVGKRFDDVVNHTQVYDSVLAKSQNMRSKNPLTQMSTAFMSEPTLNANLYYSAVTGDHTAGQRAGIVTSVIASNLLAAAMASLISAWNKDDDDRKFTEKYLAAFASRAVDNLNPMTMYPYLSDLWSMVSGYDIERTDMSVVQDIWNYGSTFYKKLAEGEDITWRDRENFYGTIANLFGIPGKNVSRDIRRIRNLINTDKSASSPSAIKYTLYENAIPLGLWKDSNTAYYERYLAALKDGDKQEQYDLKDYLMSTKHVKESDFVSGVRDAYKKEYKKGGIKKDDAISFLLANNLVTGETADKKKQSAFQYVDKWDEGTANYSAYNTLESAFTDGNSAKIQQAWNELTSNGYSNEQVGSQARSCIKALVESGTITPSKATELLRKWYPYKNDNDNLNKPKEWAE